MGQIAVTAAAQFHSMMETGSPEELCIVGCDAVKSDDSQPTFR